MKNIHLHTSLALLLAWCAPVISAEEKQTASEGKKDTRLITIDQAYDMTLASDQAIRIAYYEIKKANLDPWSALARLGPSITGNANANATRNRATKDNRSAYDTDGRTADITWDQPILDFSVFPAYRFGRLSAQAAKLTYKSTIRNTLFGVAQAYYDVLKQERVVQINQETVNLAQNQVELAQARFDAGAVARIDVLRARVTLENARNTLIQSKGALEISRNTLSQILNLGGATDFVLAEPAPSIGQTASFDESLKNAYANREDYKVSAIAVQKEIALKGEVIAGYAPRLSAQARAGLGDGNGRDSAESDVRSASLNVSMPFLNGGQREIDLQKAASQVSQRKLEFEQTEKSIESEVKTAWITVNTTQESIQALKAEVEASTQNYQDLEAQYEAGTATSLDVQSALRDLNNSRTQLNNQTYQLQVALRDLQRAEALFENGRVAKARVK